LSEQIVRTFEKWIAYGILSMLQLDKKLSGIFAARVFIRVVLARQTPKRLLQLLLGRTCSF